MIDPTSAPQVVQQVHPSWFDWITVAAIITGPVLALFAQRALDWLREKKNRRVDLYLTAMSYRATWLNPESIKALNLIDTVFDKARDEPVRAAWAAVLTQTRIPRPEKEDRNGRQQAWDARMFDLRVDLYQLLGQAVGYDHTVDYIKNQIYYPQAHMDIELEQMQIRKQFAKAITDEGLKVIVTQTEEPRAR